MMDSSEQEDADSLNVEEVVREARMAGLPQTQVSKPKEAVNPSAFVEKEPGSSDSAYSRGRDDHRPRSGRMRSRP